MNLLKNNSLESEEIILAEEITVGKNDEEVLNCEGGPCNFILKHI
jgi:hypothetical protein